LGVHGLSRSERIGALQGQGPILGQDSNTSKRERQQMRLRTALLVSALAVGVFVLPAATASSAQPKGTYIVQMLADPVVAYKGGVAGLAATKPAKGQKIDPNSAKVQKYADHLKGAHSAALAKAGGGQKLYDYVYSFNGFAADLTTAQANALEKVSGVVAVSKDEKQTLDTSSTPAFLGLSDPGGLWSQLGGTGTPAAQPPTSTKGAGENVIVGIIDGGIWPEHPSVSDRIGGKLVYQQIPGWHGKCVPGEQFTASNCNHKLIGARYYNAAWGGNAGIDAQLPHEFNSPRDYGGHGTHTATTAAGNANVAATGDAALFGAITGIAPRARIAAYKTCWQTPAGGSCFSSDSVAAIDQAVADGVDVLNYSISGSQTNFRDAVEIAFLFAADAGVFVAASAGNSGPTVSTVAHPGPWLTTVAAGTHNRDGNGSVTIDGVTYPGKSLATAVSGPLTVFGTKSVGTVQGDTPAEAARLCFPGSLAAGSANGKIVMCERGVNARIEKSQVVKNAGGIGMILVNWVPGSVNADFHFVPTVHLPDTDYTAIEAAAVAGKTASIATATVVYNAPAPFTASFSSRGPLQAGAGDLLKPDLIAPGQDVLAGVAPPGNSGRLFDVYSGTSMSSPHVAGLGALMKQLKPGWSPMMIKSALMTSGYDVLDGPNTNPLVIFRQGAGHVRPNSARDPGLVFDHGFNDWLAFICNKQPQGLESTCNALWGAGYPTDASDLNVPSIAIGDLVGSQTVTRKVTNVGSTAATYNAAVTGLTGFATTVTPSTLNLAPGQTGTFTVTIETLPAATLNAYTGGQLTWSDGTHNVRIPLVVRPVALSAPAQVSGNGGPINYNVKFGYNGPFAATPRGLVAPTITPGNVADDPTDGSCATLTAGPDKIQVPVTIPAGTTYARFSLFDADVAAGSDIDLCVIRVTGANSPALAGSSTTGTSQEEVNLVNPTAADYIVVVHGWGVPAGGSPFKLHTWVLGSANAGNMTVTAPASAVLGTTGNIGLTFSGLAPATKYLGSVAYSGTAGLPNPTIVRVDTP
jgi:hypothetical protein